MTVTPKVSVHLGCSLSLKVITSIMRIKSKIFCKRQDSMVKNIIDKKLRHILDGGISFTHGYIIQDMALFSVFGYSEVVWFLVALELCYCIFVFFLVYFALG